MKLGLGTAQFGLDYGISNTNGQCPPAEAQEILVLADQAGVEIIDTAASYGDSEAVLGRILPAGNHFRIITKSPPLPSSGGDSAFLLNEAFRSSLVRLGVKRIHGLLLHRTRDILGPEGKALFQAMLGLKEQGLIARIGVSSYLEDEVLAVLARFPVDIVQVPISVFDQRLLRSGLLSRLHGEGIEVHVRSVLLQGLLVMSPDDVPPYFDPIRPQLRHYHAEISRAGMTPLHAALSFARQLVGADTVLVGVRSVSELQEVVQAFDAVAIDQMEFDRFALDDVRFVNPVNWPLN